MHAGATVLAIIGDTSQRALVAVGAAVLAAVVVGVVVVGLEVVEGLEVLEVLRGPTSEVIVR